MDLAKSLTRRLAGIVSPTSGTDSKQLYFAALVVGFSALVSISHPELMLAADYLTALGMLALATMLALTVRWEDVRPAWGAVVLVLDMGAVALARDAAREHTIAISLLMRVPTLWLAARLRRNGVLIAEACTLVMISLPSLVRASHIDSLAVAHSLVLPFIVLQIGMLTVGALTVMDGRNQQLAVALAEQESLLESAAASERLLENVIDSVDVGIVVVDRDGHDVLMNRAQRRIHQLASPPGNDDPNESQLLLWHPGSALPMPPEQRPVRRAVLQETFTNSLVAMGQTQREARVLSASARQVIDHRGERSGAVVVFSDVTSYIDMVRSQEQFVAAVSHELRTPLTSVIGYLELAVTDTRIGMSDQEQANLFTDYYRTETARNSDIPGHGIGLSLTRRIVVAHGGQISVSSRPGEGSTFTIRFGLDEVEWADRA